MNILETIIAHKRSALVQQKLQVPVSQLMRSPFFERDTYSLRSGLLDQNKTGIIAEFKRRSPSKGIINETAEVDQITQQYHAHGASGISVLTDQFFFGGSQEDLIAARKNEIPLLRKEFIIDEYQVIESKALGADVILLIAACLPNDELQSLARLARSLNMEVLLEIHQEKELNYISDSTELVGVNNRNLKNFEVDLDHARALVKQIPDDKIKIAESGIHSVATLKALKQGGFQGFLMGEYFMSTTDPGYAFRQFAEALQESEK